MLAAESSRIPHRYAPQPRTGLYHSLLRISPVRVQARALTPDASRTLRNPSGGHTESAHRRRVEHGSCHFVTHMMFALPRIQKNVSRWHASKGQGRTKSVASKFRLFTPTVFVFVVSGKVDVMFLYTAQTVEDTTTAQMETLLNEELAVVNQGNMNSEIDLVYTLVYVGQVSSWWYENN